MCLQSNDDDGVKWNKRTTVMMVSLNGHPINRWTRFEDWSTFVVSGVWKRVRLFWNECPAYVFSKGRPYKQVKLIWSNEEMMTVVTNVGVSRSEVIKTRVAHTNLHFPRSILRPLHTTDISLTFVCQSDRQRQQNTRLKCGFLQLYVSLLHRTTPSSFQLVVIWLKIDRLGNDKKKVVIKHAQSGKRLFTLRKGSSGFWSWCTFLILSFDHDLGW